MLPGVLLDIIADYATEERFLDWISKDQLYIIRRSILVSPLTINKDPWLVTHDTSIKKRKWQFPESITYDVILQENKFSWQDWEDILSNPHPRVVEMLINSDSKHFAWRLFSNPGAIEWVKNNVDYYSGIKTHMSSNPHPWAINYLKNNQGLINIGLFALNPGITYLSRPDLRCIFTITPK